MSGHPPHDPTASEEEEERARERNGARKMDMRHARKEETRLMRRRDDMEEKALKEEGLQKAAFAERLTKLRECDALVEMAEIARNSPLVQQARLREIQSERKTIGGNLNKAKKQFAESDKTYLEKQASYMSASHERSIRQQAVERTTAERDQIRGDGAGHRGTGRRCCPGRPGGSSGWELKPLRLVLCCSVKKRADRARLMPRASFQLP